MLRDDIYYDTLVVTHNHVIGRSARSARAFDAGVLSTWMSGSRNTHRPIYGVMRHGRTHSLRLTNAGSPGILSTINPLPLNALRFII